MRPGLEIYFCVKYGIEFGASLAGNCIAMAGLSKVKFSMFDAGK